ncbi:MAG: PKD domain-containing protein [Saprospiraceae bacterium]
MKHANGRDWWVVVSDFLGYFYKVFILSPEGLNFVSEQDFGGIPPGVFGLAGTISFSNDGTKMAQYEVPLDNVVIYDFDRCTGTISNPVIVPLPEATLGGGQSFSPNSRFFYMVSSDFILQLDLWTTDIATSLDTVAIYDGYLSPWPTTFFASQLGPDGRIYINTNNGTDILHYINKPNLKGDSCQVIQHGLQLAARNRFTSPHFPNYRLGPLDGSPCDTLGLDNHPLAGFRWEADTLNPLLVEFTDNSFYEPTEWSWDFGDGAGSAEVNPLHEYSGPGTYTVCLTVSNQYDSDTFCREVAVVATEAEEALQGIGFELFPNPAYSSLHITAHLLIGTNGAVSLTAYNILGQPIWQEALPVAGGEIQTFVDVNTWPPGVYFISIEADGQVRGVEKVVVR